MVKWKRRWCVYSVLFALWASACSSFLDVAPKDQYLQDKVFERRETIELALQGIYTQLTADGLYGSTLTLSGIDVMGQYYDCTSGYPSNHQLMGFQFYDYGNPVVSNTFSAVWKEAYAAILNINSFIARMRPSTGVVSEEEKEQLLGQAYGLRALLHFDLLRLFGPVYVDQPDAEAIPYQLAPIPTVQPFETARIVGRKVLADIDTATSLLAADAFALPGSGVQGLNRRFNYFAALALTARVNLYVGNKAEAMRAARVLITEELERFPLTSPATSGHTSAADSMFSSEVIFGLHHPRLHQQFNQYFDPSASELMLLSPVLTRLEAVYDGNLDDVRRRWNWQILQDGLGGLVPIFVRYYRDNLDYIPLFRISELWLIAAECAPDEETAFSFLTRLQKHRNTYLMLGKPLESLLAQAYQQEFWGEGQTFFYFKRRYSRQIPSASGGGMLAMGAMEYVVPIPREEQLQR